MSKRTPPKPAKVPSALAAFDAVTNLALAAMPKSVRTAGERLLEDIACKLFDQRGDAKGVGDG